MAVTREEATLAKTGTGALGKVFSGLSSIPVVGIFLGITGAALTAASSAYNPERAAHRELMLKQGTDPDYATFYARAQTMPTAKLEQEVFKLRQKKRSPREEQKARAFIYTLALRSTGAQITAANNTVLAELTREKKALQLRTMFIGGGTLLATATMFGLLFIRRRGR